MPINLANKNRRDARVSLLGVRPKRAVRWLDGEKREAKTVRLLQCDAKHATDRLLREFEGDLNELAQAIETAEERFHELMKLLGTATPAESQVEASVESLDEQQALVAKLWEKTGAHINRPAQ